MILMRLPDAIFERRLNSEYEEMRQSGTRFEVSPDWTQYTVSLRGPGFCLENGQIVPKTQHTVLIELLREYPYPGGVEVYWLSPIFHPNIRASDGAVCIQLVNAWRESQNLISLVQGLYHLLENPNPQSPLNEDAARYYLEHPDLQQRRPSGPRVIKL